MEVPSAATKRVPLFCDLFLTILCSDCVQFVKKVCTKERTRKIQKGRCKNRQGLVQSGGTGPCFFILQNVFLNAFCRYSLQSSLFTECSFTEYSFTGYSFTECSFYSISFYQPHEIFLIRLPSAPVSSRSHTPVRMSAPPCRCGVSVRFLRPGRPQSAPADRPAAA